MAASVAAPSREAPMRDQLLSTLVAFNALTSHLFTHISSPNPPPNLPSLPTLQTTLGQLEEHTKQLLDLQSEHAEGHRRMEKLAERVQEQEVKWKGCVEVLDQTEKSLARICNQGQKDREEMEAVKKAAFKPSQILSYARLVSPYSSAPPFGPLASSHPVDGATEGEPKTRTAMPDPMRDPSLRALMPFPSEEIVHRGRMGLAIALTEEQRQGREEGMGIGPEVGETRAAAAATRSALVPPTTVRPTMEAEDDVFDLDLNPDL